MTFFLIGTDIYGVVKHRQYISSTFFLVIPRSRTQHRCDWGKETNVKIVFDIKITTHTWIHHVNQDIMPQISKFMGPTWGPPGSCRPQMGPMLAPWSLLSGAIYWAFGGDFTFNSLRVQTLESIWTGGILLMQYEPFNMAAVLNTNSRMYTGYNIEVFDLIAKKLNFRYVLRLLIIPPDVTSDAHRVWEFFSFICKCIVYSPWELFHRSMCLGNW